MSASGMPGLGLDVNTALTRLVDGFVPLKFPKYAFSCELTRKSINKGRRSLSILFEYTIRYDTAYTANVVTEILRQYSGNALRTHGEILTFHAMGKTEVQSNGDYTRTANAHIHFWNEDAAEFVLHINRYLPRQYTVSALDTFFTEDGLLDTSSIPDVFLRNFRDRVPSYGGGLFP